MPEGPDQGGCGVGAVRLTGSNEGYLITERGLFGIWQWEVLPAEIQTRAVADLVARQLSDETSIGCERLYRRKQNRFVKKFALALQTQGFPKQDFARVGL